MQPEPEAAPPPRGRDVQLRQLDVAGTEPALPLRRRHRRADGVVPPLPRAAAVAVREPDDAPARVDGGEERERVARGVARQDLADPVVADPRPDARDLGPARRTVDADGLLVTPGFVDIHTHFDGQVTWDDDLTPSCWHGVTTAVLGNCGVGFAPVRPDGRTELIELMEGVEDIPGTALSDGIRWDWESFPDYLDALDRAKRNAEHTPEAT